MEYYLVLRKKEILLFVKIWMNLEDIMWIWDDRYRKCCARIAEFPQTGQEPRMDAKTVRNFITSSSRDSSHNGEGAPSESGESFLYCLAGSAGREA